MGLTILSCILNCMGARVNGRLVSLDSTLVSGDSCEIFTSNVEGAGPSRDWLGFVQSPRAKSKIKNWFTRERREDMVETGRDDLTAELRREGLPVQRIWTSDAFLQELEALNMTDIDTLFAAIGGVFTLVLLKLAVPLNENLLESFVEPPSPML